MRVILDGRTLTPAQVAAVAREGRPVSLDDAARARNAAAAEALAALLEAGTPVYGVTTGVGPLRSRELGPGERAGISCACCAATRAARDGRLRQSGCAPRWWCAPTSSERGAPRVSDDLLERCLPRSTPDSCPSRASWARSGTGDLTVLADIALALLGEGRAWRDGRVVAAKSALADAGLVAPRLGPRDGLAFMSSNAAAIGHAALVAVDAERQLSASLAVAALFLPRVRGRPRRAGPPRSRGPLPSGPGRLAERCASCSAHTRRRRPGGGPRSAIHDPYPFRALAQVEGASVDAVEQLDAVLAVELNAAGENALIDADPPAALPAGNFHAGAARGRPRPPARRAGAVVLARRVDG